MARPTKSITTRAGHMSKNEIDVRIEYEIKLRGESDRIRPPSFMSHNKTDQQLQEQMKQLIKQTQPKPPNCATHIMNLFKCKSSIYNIGICCDM